VGSIPITRSSFPAHETRRGLSRRGALLMIVTTTNELEGYRVVRHLGVARGLTVRSRSVVGNIGAAIQILFGGTISVYSKLAEETRQEAFDLLIKQAEAMGANAILAMRYDANEIASAVTEVLAYGTAVVVEKTG
jgi:uncharacterized protein YbjQ (UPF0145 family)